MQEPIDLVVITEEKRKTGGLSIAVLVSLILHSALVIWFVTRPREVAPAASNKSMVRYVQLLQRQQPQQEQKFVEAPGIEAMKRAPLTAPLSDKNRQASMPEPTGPTPTPRPGDGRGLYIPEAAPQPRNAQEAQQQQQQQQPAQQAAAAQGAATPQTVDSGRAQTASNETFVYRETPKATAASAAIDWRTAVKAVRAPIGGAEGLDLGNAGGGDKGHAEQGPLSFETQWYNWGDYAQSMVSRIRVNWYANMPQLIRTGIAGVVTIRFTIQRDGRITEVAVLSSSGHPPYDFAARKAIELSSPLNPLPKDFPNPNERVTAMFYYNRQID
ncbi:MAG TPA: energy transducer TonB [Thermoanaerobaculia bacterium]